MRHLTLQQAQREYRNYCDMQQIGTTPISFEEYIRSFKIILKA